MEKSQRSDYWEENSVNLIENLRQGGNNLHNERYKRNKTYKFTQRTHVNL